MRYAHDEAMFSDKDKILRLLNDFWVQYRIYQMVFLWDNLLKNTLYKCEVQAALKRIR